MKITLEKYRFDDDECRAYRVRVDGKVVGSVCMMEGGQWGASLAETFDRRVLGYYRRRRDAVAALVAEVTP